MGKAWQRNTGTRLRLGEIIRFGIAQKGNDTVKELKKRTPLHRHQPNSPPLSADLLSYSTSWSRMSISTRNWRSWAWESSLLQALRHLSRSLALLMAILPASTPPSPLRKPGATRRGRMFTRASPASHH